MPDTPDTEPTKSQKRRLWITVGEVIAVLGLGLGGLNYWQGLRDRAQADRVEAQKAQSQVEAERRSVFLMRGEADRKGERIMLQPTDPGQVVQTQRYVFPTPVRDRGREIGAGRLQIDLVWFEDGLKAALRAARDDGALKPAGEAALPVGIITTYIEKGETHTDRSLYRVGYQIQPGLLPRTVKLTLLGVAPTRRGLQEDVQAAVDAAWRGETQQTR